MYVWSFFHINNNDDNNNNITNNHNNNEAPGRGPARAPAVSGAVPGCAREGSRLCGVHLCVCVCVAFSPIRLALGVLTYFVKAGCLSRNIARDPLNRGSDVFCLKKPMLLMPKSIFYWK